MLAAHSNQSLQHLRGLVSIESKACNSSQIHWFLPLSGTFFAVATMPEMYSSFVLVFVQSHLSCRNGS